MIIEHSSVIVGHSILMGLWKSPWTVCRSRVACWLPGHLRCWLCSIAVATCHELLHLRLHSTDMLHDCLQCVASFRFSRLVLHTSGRTSAAILRSGWLNLFLVIARNIHITRLRWASYRFQDILDMLAGSSPSDNRVSAAKLMWATLIGTNAPPGRLAGGSNLCLLRFFNFSTNISSCLNCLR